ncbi:MAG: hypothetical protein AB1744_15950, partial [Candidatus Zixiibacteriota bacterium]
TRLTSGGALTNITGYSQTGGKFTILQKGTALNDLVTLTVDERNKPIDRNTTYSTLVLKRYDGAVEAAALYVDEGNAIFDGQVRLGRYSSNPTAIGTGSIVYNSTDNSIYYWDNSTWQQLVTGTSNVWTRTSGVLHPTTTTDDLAIGGTDSTAPFFVDNSGNLDVSGHGSFGAGASYNANYTLNIDEDYSNTGSGITTYGIYNDTVRTESSTITANTNTYGLYSILTYRITEDLVTPYHGSGYSIRGTVLADNAYTYQTLYGVTGEAYSTSTATTNQDQLSGLVGWAYNGGTGTVTDAVGTWGIGYNNNATGAITTAYGVRGATYENSTGPITTGYGGHFYSKDAATNYGLHADARP